MRGLHRGPVNSSHKWPVTRIFFPFNDVIMESMWHLEPATWFLSLPLTASTWKSMFIWPDNAEQQWWLQGIGRIHRVFRSLSSQATVGRVNDHHPHSGKRCSPDFWTSTSHNDAITWKRLFHYNDVIMGAIASQITSLTIVYSIVYSDADQRKH